MTRKIMLALQGGGAHGAYTWGVLDRLLEETDLEIAAISGTSAGAMNGAVLAYGLGPGRQDRQNARAKLREFWEEVSAIGDAAFNPYRLKNPMDGTWNTDGLPPFVALNMLGAGASPYDTPFRTTHPLVPALDKCLPDVRQAGRGIVPLYVCATNVRTMERRVFSSLKEEISVAAITASAAIPNLFQAVEVEPGNFYWDGGFLGNPVLRNLLHHKDECTDILIVEINPWEREEVPRRSWEIADRQNEITFNSSLILEINAIQTVNELLPHLSSGFPGNRKEVFFHHIASRLSDLGVNSKYNTGMGFLQELRGRGHEAAGKWLRAHKDSLNRASSLPVRDWLDQALGK